MESSRIRKAPSHIKCSSDFKNPLTGQHHSLLKALFEATELTSVPLSFVNLTISIGNATVNALILHSSFEETFASGKQGVEITPKLSRKGPQMYHLPFTCDYAVVQASGSIFANITQ